MRFPGGRRHADRRIPIYTARLFRFGLKKLDDLAVRGFWRARASDVIAYRREIDGLRAIAVLLVILFHAGFESFRGGYVGVDVFFVISGYLIASIILAELAAGEFSIVGFYERRARRILPALFVVMAACLPFAWAWLMPVDMKHFAQSLLGTAIFASNIVFWLQSGYFDTASELKPLLHTWSLAVEEQYYLIVPLFLAYLWRFGLRAVAAALIGVVLLSLAAAQWGAFHWPAANFFLLPTRAWELAIGALTALYLAYSGPPTLGIVLRNALSLAGLGAIAIAVFGFDAKTPFPSLYALLPVLGTAAIVIFATPATWIGALLGTRALVGVGLVSYSAYLWHQPLFAFARWRFDTKPGLAMLGLAALALVLAYLSWRFVERPFRDRRRFTRGQIFVLAGLATAFFAGIGWAGMATGGFASRFDAAERRILDSYARSMLFACDADSCLPRATRGNDWVLIGDSNAYHFSMPLAERVAAQGYALHNLAKGGCIPVAGFARRDQPDSFNEACAAHIARVRQFLARPDAPNNIVISAAWGLYVYGDEYRPGEGFESFSNIQSFPVDGARPEASLRIGHVVAAIEREIAIYAALGKTIHLVGPMPYLLRELPRTAAERLRLPEPYPHEFFVRQHAELLVAFDRLAALPNVKLFRPDAALCPETPRRMCLAARYGLSLYGDRTHLSDFGARAIFAPYFEAAIR